MNKKLLYPFLLLATLSSCLFTPNFINKVDTTDFKKIAVSDISFFGEIKIDSSKNKKKEIKLFYNQSDSLFIINTNKQKPAYHLISTAEPNMLVGNLLGPRYLNVDTIVFTKEKCYHKKVLYGTDLNREWKEWAGMTLFSIYMFENDELKISDNRYGRNDSLHAFRGINDFIKKDMLDKSFELSPFSTLERGIEMESSKMIFFRSYF